MDVPCALSSEGKTGCSMGLGSSQAPLHLLTIQWPNQATWTCFMLRGVEGELLAPTARVHTYDSGSLLAGPGSTSLTD
jgi:hypothetical protein